jgi:hypothetical protein
MKKPKLISTLLLLLIIVSLISGCTKTTDISNNTLPGDNPIIVTKEDIDKAPSTSGIKGVNNPHIWYDSQAYNALDTIKSYGFNTVRCMATNGSASD